LRARIGHEVRWVLVLPSEAAHEVAERLAEGVFGPLPGPRRAEAGQRVRRRDPRRSQSDLLQSGRLGGSQLGEAQPLGERACQLLQLLRRQPLALVAPAPELPPPDAGLHELRALWAASV